MNPIRPLISTVAVAALSSCAALGGGRTLSLAPEIPWAEGAVKFTKIDGGGTAVELRVRNLMEPERLDPPGYAYVAWVRGAREDPPRNVGALSLSEDLSGELRTTTEHACSELFVTVEATGDAERPTGRRLFWARRD